jgi:hypothetical protein
VDRQHRPGEGLLAGRAVGDAALDLVLTRAALADLVLDEGQRHQQQQRHEADGDEFEKQFLVHEFLPG